MRLARLRYTFLAAALVAACGEGGDGGGTADAAVDAAPFTPMDASFVDGGTTALTWADVGPTFITFCIDCHGEPSRGKKLDDYRFDKYDVSDPVAPINDDLGVYEARVNIHSELTSGKMPPNSEPQPSAGQVGELIEWIEAGAPKE